VFAYPEQYFDQAYTIGTNGTPTTNSAGLLSPYGEFFPTMPGPVVLTTKPDAATDSQGTGIVNVIKLQLDVNHDGIMDLSFGGPDNTSQGRPYVFWINNDSDRSTSASSPPGYDPGHDREVTFPHPDYDYLNWEPTSIRDLEDYARLWICGVPALTNGGYQVALTWANASGNPAINIIKAAEVDGGTLYLTDTNTAFSQRSGYAGYGMKYPTISTTNSLTLPAAWFTNAGDKHFLFEGAGVGSGQLLLTVSQIAPQGTNVIAQTGAWLDLHDIKDLYERGRATNVDVGGPPSTKTSVMVRDKVLAASSSEAKQLIVHVHGAANTPWLYENKSETMFKRLYWQGYEGRFACFRWPSPKMGLIALADDEAQYTEFNREEFVAFKSGAALKEYIADLRDRLPGYTINLAPHSCGGIVVNEAIREGAVVDSVALMQVAVSAECFDGSNTNLIYAYLATAPGNTPDPDALGGYNNCFTNAARRVNFYNDDDYNLFTGFGRMWVGNQYSLKPYYYSNAGGTAAYSFNGANCSLTDYGPDGFPISTTLVTDDHEKKAFVARSRTRAAGQAGLKYTPYTLTSGSITNNINLQDATLGFVGGAQFGNSMAEHSGEFTKPIQTAMPFYRQLLESGFKIHAAQ
jgi:hypothetical protein